ncbi:hypothetical protein D9613_000996 [Agrocybe pediades]|uniref:SET domain-containing protein n=1 Tax=Agrocybe pediades TaxID=84607 RepID=A0A8H4R0K4_9AGAR|nr:hypothetical protein D9613_000996 [Agrocybe pediades]KAF9563014.1 SET domain-containing protein [Agrocybe pediades]
MSNQVNILLDWCTANSVHLDPRISIVESHESNGICVYSKDSFIPPETTLVKIPKDAVLSTRTCSLAGIIPIIPFGLGAQLSLAVALHVEMLRGESSRWYGYIRSLPNKPADLPLFWAINACGSLDGLEALSWLRGTEADKILRAPSSGNGASTLEEINRYYHDVAEPLLLRHSGVWQCTKAHGGLALKDFYYAFSMVSSRAFLVDAYHGLAMVPVADAFNHVVENNVHLESDFNVCPECGALYECVHDRDEHDEDDGDHDRRPPAATSGDERDIFFEMVSNAGIPSHSEIFNTYGERLTNAELLNQYGFILDVNDNDHLSWTMDEVLHLLSSEPVSRQDKDNVLRRFREVSSILRHSDATSLLSRSNIIHFLGSDNNSFSINSEGVVSHMLWTLLFVLSTRRQPETGLQAQLLAVLALQEQFELSLAEEDDDDGGGEVAVDETDVGLARLRVLLDIAGMVVTLCRERKRLSGKPGSEGLDLSELMEGIPSELPRTHLALSVLIGERSILDSCAAAWESLADGIKTIA